MSRTLSNVANAEWLRKHDLETAYCTICQCTVSVVKGYQAVENHSRSKKHNDNVSAKLPKSQLEIKVPTLNSHSQTTNEASPLAPQNEVDVRPSLELYCRNDATSRAEILWILKVATSNYSLRSCDNIPQLFNEMFRNSLETKSMTLNRTKARYLLTEASGPYFYNKLISEIRASEVYYTVMFDETCNSANRKELQVATRYWSKSENKVIISHLQTFFLGSATAKIIFDHICLTLKNADLSWAKLLMVGSDGPNVNKTVFSLLNEEAKKLRSNSRGLLSIGSCNIHKVHNAFAKGLEEVGGETSEFIIALRNFIYKFPNREDDFRSIQEKLQLPTVKIPKHVSVRWLTVRDCLKIIIEQMPAIREYFSNFIPKNKPELMNSRLFKIVNGFLLKETYKAELEFVYSIASTFTTVTERFQSSSEVLIQSLYSEIRQLYVTLLNRVRKPSSISFITFDRSKLDLLPVKDVKVPQKVKDEISKIKERNRLEFLLACQKSYLVMAEYLYNKCIGIPEVAVLRFLRFLKPNNIQVTENTNSTFLEDVAKVSQLLNLDEIDNTSLEDECALLRSERSVFENKSKKTVMEFWNKVFALKCESGIGKYPNLTLLVQACFTLSHGNSDVERGFSISGDILTDSKTAMSVELLNAILNTRSGMKGTDPHLFIVDKEFIRLSRVAKSSYDAACVEKRRQKERANEARKQEEKKKAAEKEKKEIMKKRKSKLIVYEKELEEVQLELKKKRKMKEDLFELGNKRLKQALKANNMDEVRTAQHILDSIHTMKPEEQTLDKKREDLEKRINQTKNKLLVQN
jgi:hypothetical protein